MHVLGLNLGFDPVNRTDYEQADRANHDTTAVLLRDGEIVAAIEEERIDRIKHSNKFPVQAIRACVDIAGIGLGDIDRVALNWRQDYINAALVRGWLLGEPTFLLTLREPLLIRDVVGQLFAEYLGHTLDPERIDLIPHHRAHAASAYHCSGFDDGLIVVWDGQGDDVSTSLWDGREGSMRHLCSHPPDKSLGYFYLSIIRFLGYAYFDEYKVMGLAPYGDPSRFRTALQRQYTLLPNGDLAFHRDRLHELLACDAVRFRGEAFNQEHRDLAAALQEALEHIGFHILRHYRTHTNARDLCIAGGVGHNCTLNGKILNSGMFERVFVQPAAHDAGTALGAAIECYRDHASQPAAIHPAHLFLGRALASSEEIERRLDAWREFVTFERVDDVASAAADLLASGSVIGWVQGRSEFGPRALGNRSILADPRPEDNKRIINAMIKKREGYRPFAPSVIEGKLTEYFEVPDHCKRLPYMIFVVSVREHARATLGAITHVDGTARVQTVSREDNERYWRLIHGFGERTGIYMVLNTSFNNNVEPIVDSVEDAIGCFLTTGLHHLVVDDFVVSKKHDTEQPSPAQLDALYIALAPNYRVHCVTGVGDRGDLETRYFCTPTVLTRKPDIPLSQAAFRVVSRANGDRTIAALIGDVRRGAPSTADAASLHDELFALWCKRIIIPRPLATSAGLP